MKKIDLVEEFKNRKKNFLEDMLSLYKIYEKVMERKGIPIKGLIKVKDIDDILLNSLIYFYTFLLEVSWEGYLSDLIDEKEIPKRVKDLVTCVGEERTCG